MSLIDRPIAGFDHRRLAVAQETAAAIPAAELRGDCRPLSLGLTRRVLDLSSASCRKKRRVKYCFYSVVRPDRFSHALAGDSALCRNLFFEASGVQCRTFHRIGGHGTEVGPDLSDRAEVRAAEILENILEPSKRIEENHLLYLLNQEGQSTPHLVSQGPARCVLKDHQQAD